MAIINVSPSTNITALIASAAVSEGDVLLLADGVYNQTVVISKNYIRIVAAGNRAIFDGTNTLVAAFILAGVTGVEINGLIIRRYIVFGIAIIGGSANRILCNSISQIELFGIFVAGSSANLIWRNKIRNVDDGVLLIAASTSNWVIENTVKDSNFDGFESFLSVDANNAFISNFACDCGDNCFEIRGANNLVYRNTAVNATFADFLIASGNNIVAIENKGSNAQDGAVVTSNNAFLGRNDLHDNSQSGLEISGDFNIIQSNLITFNKDSGILLNSTANDNFIFFNRVECNTPADITNRGIDNNLLQNITGCRHKFGL
ncbi:right-handed parallel beta-helix repeat-containing protein [Sinanaerobacter chloroacetimidivorans]|uniref:Right-handed parallel beta-helix repeat-containing protein n=1 Tax=Sinanaerobacter chloroacetimidivorans TaxID=2818044 RepID=A0A8J7VWF3_9FIRM|nr:right-handed parallel beta-helix repeat-containing protein [Sinanaerobacter chloroacetimidivorans]MBR0596292.1 right-handed parallel beta-helix repeat-containing protein [Sinanaerobacter chloroacetimidivorans]